MTQNANIATNVIESVTLVKIPTITVGSKTASLAKLITVTNSRDGVDVVVSEQVEILWGETLASVEAVLLADKAALEEEAAVVDAKLAEVQVMKTDPKLDPVEEPIEEVIP